MDEIEIAKGIVIQTFPYDGEFDEFDDPAYIQMAAFHKRYALGSKNPVLHDGTPVTLEVAQKLADTKKHKGERYVVLPVYMYDHSGLAFIAGNRTYPFNDMFDAGQLGIVYAQKRNMPRLIAKAEQQLRDAVKRYHDFQQGLYECQLRVDGELMDSCVESDAATGVDELTKRLYTDSGVRHDTKLYVGIGGAKPFSTFDLGKVNPKRYRAVHRYIPRPTTDGCGNVSITWWFESTWKYDDEKGEWHAV